MPGFHHAGHRLDYEVHGDGEQAFVLLHGLLFSKRMHGPLAAALAKRGHRVITLDLLGHGESDRPRDMWRYSMPFFAEQVVALLDHLELENAVVGGSSLGANTTLEIASAAPERLRGMVIEMPVLDNALLAVAVAFTPLVVGLTFGEPVMKLVSQVTRRVPRRVVPFLADLGLDTLRQEPGPSAAVIQGVFFGRTAPHRTERRTFDTPALVIGHRRDPIHPFSDVDLLCSELRDVRRLESSSVLALRLAPPDLVDPIASFLDDCWASPRARRPVRVA